MAQLRFVIYENKIFQILTFLGNAARMDPFKIHVMTISYCIY
mgnify:CR=1 FL=1